MPLKGADYRSGDRKVVAYVSALMAFRKMYRALDNPTKLAERLHTVPAVCIEGMVGRFAQTARGAAAYVSLLPLDVMSRT